MKIKQIEDLDFSLVELKDSSPLQNCGLTPHCKIHGAMNKVSDFGKWRCLASYYVDKSNPKNLKAPKNNCNAGCIETN